MKPTIVNLSVDGKLICLPFCCKDSAIQYFKNVINRLELEIDHEK